VERATDFEGAYALGVAASKASSPNYAVAIAAFKKAYRLGPRRRLRPSPSYPFSRPGAVQTPERPVSLPERPVVSPTAPPEG
jgi:hypothetical protein